MAIDQKGLGQRLRKIRESNGYTQVEIADLLGIPRSSVVQIESGNRSLAGIELMKLSNELGFDPRDLFASEFDEQRDSATALFRAEPKLATDKKLARVISNWSALCRQCTSLEKLIGADRSFIFPVRYEPPQPRNKWEAIQQGTVVADQERNRLKLGTGPIPELPKTMEGQGVRVGSLPLDESISGLFLTDDRIGLTILINSLHSDQRKLFSLAHEYSHLLLDRQQGGNISRLDNREENMEIRANSFAAAFLMPANGIREFLSGVGKPRDIPTLQEVYDEEGNAVRAQRRGPAQPMGLQFYDVVHLAFYFGVSYEAALWRLKALQVISKEDRENLSKKQAAANAFRRVLGERFAAHGRRFARLENAFQHKLVSMALEAYRLGEISKSKLKEITSDVDLSSDEFNALLSGIKADTESIREGIRIPR